MDQTTKDNVFGMNYDWWLLGTVFQMGVLSSLPDEIRKSFWITIGILSDALIEWDSLGNPPVDMPQVFVETELNRLHDRAYVTGGTFSFWSRNGIKPERLFSSAPEGSRRDMLEASIAHLRSWDEKQRLVAGFVPMKMSDSGTWAFPMYAIDAVRARAAIKVCQSLAACVEDVREATDSPEFEEAWKRWVDAAYGEKLEVSVAEAVGCWPQRSKKEGQDS